MKRAQAIAAAAVMTAILALGMVAIGAGALTNQHTAPTLTRTAATEPLVQTVDTTSAEQLQTLVAQYQQRLAQDEQQLQEANGQIEQLQGVLVALQQRGVISIGDDGAVTIGHTGRQSRFVRDDEDDDD